LIAEEAQNLVARIRRRNKYPLRPKMSVVE
jgi:hypothetical protein